MHMDPSHRAEGSTLHDRAVQKYSHQALQQLGAPMLPLEGDDVTQLTSSLALSQHGCQLLHTCVKLQKLAITLCQSQVACIHISKLQTT